MPRIRIVVDLEDGRTAEFDHDIPTRRTMASSFVREPASRLLAQVSREAQAWIDTTTHDEQP